MEVLEWLQKNREWVFSGVGVAIFIGLFGALKSLRRRGISDDAQIVINNTQSLSVASQSNGTDQLPRRKQKSEVSVLFIDDDVKFQVVNILKKNGWTNTRIIRDVTSLEQPEVASADIFFVDIQGVGTALQFKDQGLGLAKALRRIYPTKKLVIYSAENADAFHSAFKEADDRISKDADPYEFMEIVGRLSA